MLIEEYISDSPKNPEDVDLVEEFSTMSRVLIEEDDVHPGLVTIKHRPDEFVTSIVDEEWDRSYETPVETTVLVVDKDELLDRESVATRQNTENVYRND